ISVITPYDAALTERLVAFLGELGVLVTRSTNLFVGGGGWRVNYRTVADLTLKGDDPGAGAVSVGCASPPFSDIVAPLERQLNKPVLTANQLTVWACLGRMGLNMVGPGRWLQGVFEEDSTYDQRT